MKLNNQIFICIFICLLLTQYTNSVQCDLFCYVTYFRLMSMNNIKLTYFAFKCLLKEISFPYLLKHFLTSDLKGVRESVIQLSNHSAPLCSIATQV